MSTFRRHRRTAATWVRVVRTASDGTQRVADIPAHAAAAWFPLLRAEIRRVVQTGVILELEGVVIARIPTPAS